MTTQEDIEEERAYWSIKAYTESHEKRQEQEEFLTRSLQGGTHPLDLMDLMSIPLLSMEEYAKMKASMPPPPTTHSVAKQAAATQTPVERFPSPKTSTSQGASIGVHSITAVNPDGHRSKKTKNSLSSHTEVIIIDDELEDDGDNERKLVDQRKRTAQKNHSQIIEYYLKKIGTEFLPGSNGGGFVIDQQPNLSQMAKSQKVKAASQFKGNAIPQDLKIRKRSSLPSSKNSEVEEEEVVMEESVIIPQVKLPVEVPQNKTSSKNQPPPQQKKQHYPQVQSAEQSIKEKSVPSHRVPRKNSAREESNRLTAILDEKDQSQQINQQKDSRPQEKQIPIKQQLTEKVDVAADSTSAPSVYTEEEKEEAEIKAHEDYLSRMTATMDDLIGDDTSLDWRKIKEESEAVEVRTFSIRVEIISSNQLVLI